MVAKSEAFARGGTGDVFRGFMRGLPVAIKRVDDSFRPEVASDDLVTREIDLLGRVPRHPNIVRLQGYAMEAGHPSLYLVYDYMEGGDLAKALASSPGLTELERLKVLRDACDGLCFCHEGCGGAFGGEILLHRDLKPENVLLRREVVSGDIVAALGDFGISKLLPASAAKGHATTQHLMGTVGYIAPEALHGHIGPDSDLYALGVIILQVATGLPPRLDAPTARNPTRTLAIRDHIARAVSDGTLMSTSRLHWTDEGVLGALVDIGIGCCAEDPEDRMLLRHARDRLTGLWTHLLSSAGEGAAGSSAPARVGCGVGTGAFGAGGVGIPLAVSDCVVCMDAARSTRFLPCQHAACCDPCATLLLSSTRVCPLCSAPVTSAGPVGASPATFVALPSAPAPDSPSGDAYWSSMDSLEGACIAGDVRSISWLLDRGASVNAYIPIKNGDGRTPLSFASMHGQLDAARLLLHRGAAVNVGRRDVEGTPLAAASFMGHVDVVKLLLAAGADVNQAMAIGAAPLYIASSTGRLDVVQALISGGAAVNQLAGDDAGSTSLFIASKNGHAAAVRALLEGGANVNYAMIDGWTALLVASRHGHVDVARALLDGGASVNQAMKDGWTPLILASADGHEELVRALLDAGAAVNQAKLGWWTPLRVARSAGHTAVAAMLLAAGGRICCSFSTCCV